MLSKLGQLNNFLEFGGGADTLYPITFAFQRLRRSDRLSSRDKRTYKAMQGVNKKTSKLPKKPKLVTDEAAAAETNHDENSDHNAIHEKPVVDKTSSCDPRDHKQSDFYRTEYNGVSRIFG